MNEKEAEVAVVNFFSLVAAGWSALVLPTIFDLFEKKKKKKKKYNNKRENNGEKESR